MKNLFLSHGGQMENRFTETYQSWIDKNEGSSWLESYHYRLGYESFANCKEKPSYLNDVESIDFDNGYLDSTINNRFEVVGNHDHAASMRIKSYGSHLFHKKNKTFNKG